MFHMTRIRNQKQALVLLDGEIQSSLAVLDCKWVVSPMEWVVVSTSITLTTVNYHASPTRMHNETSEYTRTSIELLPVFRVWREIFQIDFEKDKNDETTLAAVGKV